MGARTCPLVNLSLGLISVVLSLIGLTGGAITGNIWAIILGSIGIFFGLIGSLLGLSELLKSRDRERGLAGAYPDQEETPLVYSIKR